MKKMKMFILPVLALSLSLVSCARFDDDEEEEEQYVVDDTIVPDTSVSGTMKIRYFKRGFGDKWLYNVIETFQTKYPNVKVQATPSTEAKVVYGDL